jgi:quercetin dioxygenase-like cupin family protein
MISGMHTWDLTTLDVHPHHPVVLHSDEGAARVVAIKLPAGEELQEHEVHEHAWLHVHQGAVEVDCDGRSVTAGAGALVHWHPRERHTVRATEDALMVLMLAPWPGPGHPSTPSAVAARARAS